MQQKSSAHVVLTEYELALFHKISWKPTDSVLSEILRMRGYNTEDSYMGHSTTTSNDTATHHRPTNTDTELAKPSSNRVQCRGNLSGYTATKTSDQQRKSMMTPRELGGIMVCPRWLSGSLCHFSSDHGNYIHQKRPGLPLE